ncbi:ATP-binding protein [Calditerrivibrio nitroreducens]|uniref:DUF234 DEXX-box ATPase n=1 Tax=Calditerrivibrio nitroreducens (strain DSM 19672 / NBRC 101217 / Yu37-1) TaxID=768670 RepID=E4TIK5_CALNY|nr:ATP-binding protein [Calditerrivibrio nitroreducens]ADR19053.1 DUF234 DEXX-box ATPase [Calditerrivibrio nitroreducens DSM 19672]
MKFYNRENELKVLSESERLSHKHSCMTFIVGRRRVGKTRLIKEAYKDKNLLYLFVSKKSESLLCDEYTRLISEKLGKKVIGKLSNFKEVFEYILSLGESEQINVAIDEFQEIYNINPSIFSDIQNLWDTYKYKSKINIIFSGSIYSLMSKIFENSKEPLYGRADKKIVLGGFDVQTLKSIYRDFSKEFNPFDFIAFYAITGGIPKYVELLCNETTLKFDSMLDYIFSEGSFFLSEGKDILVDEFGKDYHIYFSILSLISESKTSRSEMESILGKSIGGYLEKLEKDFQIIKRRLPVFSKPNTKNIKYYVNDNFLRFWFAFIYKNITALEIKNYEYVKDYVKKNFSVFLGQILEKYFKEKLAISGKYSYIGSYWDRKSENEIDIVALNELEKKALIAEVKINEEKINTNLLKKKSEILFNYLKGYEIEYRNFSMDEV